MLMCAFDVCAATASCLPASSSSLRSGHTDAHSARTKNIHTHYGAPVELCSEPCHIQACWELGQKVPEYMCLYLCVCVWLSLCIGCKGKAQHKTKGKRLITNTDMGDSEPRWTCHFKYAAFTLCAFYHIQTCFSVSAALLKRIFFLRAASRWWRAVRK